MKIKEINLKFEDAGITVKFLKETETLLKENQAVSLPELKELILFNADNLLNLNIISDNFITELFILATFSKNFKYSIRNKDFYIIKTEEDTVFNFEGIRLSENIFLKNLEEVFGNMAFGRSGGNKLFAIFRVSPYIFKNFRMKQLDSTVWLNNGIATIERRENIILKYKEKELSEIFFENIEGNEKNSFIFEGISDHFIATASDEKIKITVERTEEEESLTFETGDTEFLYENSVLKRVKGNMPVEEFSEKICLLINKVQEYIAEDITYFKKCFEIYNNYEKMLENLKGLDLNFL